MKAETIELTIPTYLRGEDNPYPPLSFGRRKNGYHPYPYFLQDDIDVGPGGLQFVPDKKYKAIRLSNDFLEALILPEMNGRLYSLRNRQTGREIFYRNNVIKPALVAIRGAWISGGIEFNTPSLGHSVSTVSPVFHCIENGDEECAVTLGDIDRCTRQSWQVKLILKRRRAALDIETVISNPNSYRERLYYWENAAVPASDDLRFICNSNWVVNDKVKPWPYQAGIDKSLHVNNHTPVDHFSYRQNADFFGAYYNKSRTGTYHYGFRHHGEGQKYFSWGIKEDSRIWEKFLTDSDGQYIELQYGLYQAQSVTDWLDAGDSVSFRGSWFGTADMAELKWVGHDVAVAVSVKEGRPELEIFSLSLAGCFTVSIIPEGTSVHRELQLNFTPGNVTRVAISKLNFEIRISSKDGQTVFKEKSFVEKNEVIILSPRNWASEKRQKNPLSPALDAEKYHFWENAISELKETQYLYLGDSYLLRANVMLKTNQLTEALESAYKGLEVAPWNLSLHLLTAACHIRYFRLQGGKSELWHAKDHCLAMRSGGRLPFNARIFLASCELFEGNHIYAAEILKNMGHELTGKRMAAFMLAGILRRNGDKPAFETYIGTLPPLWLENAGELYLATGNDVSLCRILETFPRACSDSMHAAEMVIEWLLAYWNFKWFDDLLKLAEKVSKSFPVIKRHPTFLLIISDVYREEGNLEKAKELACDAAKCPFDYVFCSRWEEEILLLRGLKLGKKKAKKLEFLHGLFLSENGRYLNGVKMIKAFAQSKNIHMKRAANEISAQWEELMGNRKKALLALRRAMKSGNFDIRLFLRFDSALCAVHDVKARKKLHKIIPQAFIDRGDIAFRRAAFSLDEENPENTLSILLSHRFNQFEGQSSVRRLYVDALLISGLDFFLLKNFDKAESCFGAVMEYPENLGSASYLGEHGRLARCMLGIIAEHKGRYDEAMNLWEGILSGKKIKAYAVEGMSSICNTSMRADEFAGIMLASRKAKRKNIWDESVSFLRYAVRNLKENPEEKSAWKCLLGTIRKNPTTALIESERAYNEYKCSALPKIFKRLVKIIIDQHFFEEKST